MKYIIYNPKSRNGNNQEIMSSLESIIGEKVETKVSVLDRDNYLNVLKSLTKDDSLYIVGGDGTLYYFVNDIENDNCEFDVYFYAGGTGNDFYNDVKKDSDTKLIKINEYIKDLPTVTINGETRKFINGIGFGIDGYCCEKGDELQAKSDKPVNYTAIAIKGLLFFYKRPNAKVTVDGVTKEYKKVWLAPTMKGRFYGGGMNVAPNQDRLSPNKTLTSVVWHKSGKLKTLMVFPSIFKGLLGKNKKIVDIVECHHTIVEFDRPTALQIDGETVSGVTKYEVKA